MLMLLQHVARQQSGIVLIRFGPMADGIPIPRQLQRIHHIHLMTTPVREFIVKNRRMLLEIIDSQHEEQSTSSDPDTFVRLLQSTFARGRNDAVLRETLMYLRAGRSLHIMVDQAGCLSLEEIDISTKFRDSSQFNQETEVERLAEQVDDHNKRILGIIATSDKVIREDRRV